MILVFFFFCCFVWYVLSICITNEQHRGAFLSNVLYTQLTIRAHWTCSSLSYDFIWEWQANRFCLWSIFSIPPDYSGAFHSIFFVLFVETRSHCISIMSGLSTIYKLPLLAVQNRIIHSTDACAWISVRGNTQSNLRWIFSLSIFSRIKNEIILLLIFMSLRHDWFRFLFFRVLWAGIYSAVFCFLSLCLCLCLEIYSNWNRFNGLMHTMKNQKWPFKSHSNISKKQMKKPRNDTKCWSVSWDLILLRWTVWQILHHFVCVCYKVIPLMLFHSIHI